MAGTKTDGSNAIRLDDLQQVAQVLKSNGTDGELVISFRDIAPEDINLEEPVFIVFDGLPVPFFMDSFARRGSNKALVHLTGIESIEDAEEVIGKAVYIDSESIPEMSLEEDGFAALIGWTLFRLSDTSDSLSSIEKDDEPEFEEVGKITDYIDIPGNPCIEVETKNGAVMIPLHEDLMMSVDPEYREIAMQIPAGLI